MLPVLQIVTVILIVFARGLVLAPALELPGKMRVTRKPITPCSRSITPASPTAQMSLFSGCRREALT